MDVFSDADFSNDQVDRRSITVSVITLDGAPIAWFSRKQSAVAMSTADADYRAIASALQNAILIKRTL